MFPTAPTPAAPGDDVFSAEAGALSMALGQATALLQSDDPAIALRAIAAVARLCEASTRMALARRKLLDSAGEDAWPDAVPGWLASPVDDDDADAPSPDLEAAPAFIPGPVPAPALVTEPQAVPASPVAPAPNDYDRAPVLSPLSPITGRDHAREWPPRAEAFPFRARPSAGPPPPGHALGRSYLSSA